MITYPAVSAKPMLRNRSMMIGLCTKQMTSMQMAQPKEAKYTLCKISAYVYRWTTLKPMSLNNFVTRFSETPRLLIASATNANDTFVKICTRNGVDDQNPF